MDCDPAYVPSNSAAAAAAALGSVPTADEAGRRSDSLPLGKSCFLFKIYTQYELYETV